MTDTNDGQPYRGTRLMEGATMRIKMLDSESTHVEGKAGHYRAGREYDLPDNIARAWIEKRIAEPVAATKQTTKQVKGD